MRAYYFYVEKLRLPPGIATEFGSAVHRTILERDQKVKIRTGSYEPIEKLKECLYDDLEQSSRVVNPDDPEILDLGGVAKAFGVYSDTGMSMLDKYNENRDLLSGRAVETEIIGELGGVTVIGHLDVDVSDNRILDLKTRDLTRRGSRRRTPEQVHTDYQYSTYAALKAQKTGEQDQFVDEVNAYKKNPVPDFEVVKSWRGERQHEVLESVVANLSEVFKQGLMLPVDKGSTNGWVCSQKWCGAWESVCPYGKRSQVSVALEER
jgi:hypothetical protein